MENKGKKEHILVRILLKQVGVGGEISTNDVLEKFSNKKWCPRANVISRILSSSGRFKKIRTENLHLTVAEDENYIDYDDFQPMYTRVLKNSIFRRIY